MIEKLLALIERRDSFVLTTHDPADADGLGAQMVMACLLRGRGKRVRIVNAGPVPEQFGFMDPEGAVEEWDAAEHGALVEKSALLILDTADESHMGQMREAVGRAREVFVIDHHERKPGAARDGICDPSAASTCEIAAEIALAAGAGIDRASAFAAYAGMAYDTGFFAYPKVGPRSFAAAREMARLGASPAEAHRLLCQSAPARALLLQQRAMASLRLHRGNSIASQVVRREDFAEAGALSGDTDGFVNLPLRSRDIRVSLLVKETPEGKVCCSLRSKGRVNVARVAQGMGWGGHLNASGFRSSMGLDETVEEALARASEALDAADAQGPAKRPARPCKEGIG